MDAAEYNARQLAAGLITAEHVTAATERAQRSLGLPADGKLGPDTRSALLERASRPAAPAISEPPEQRDDPFGPFLGPLERLPRNRAEVLAMFGDPGIPAKPNRTWARANIVTVRDLPGVPNRWHFQIHRFAEPYAREGLRRAAAISDYQIERAACWVLRHIRHDPARPISYHGPAIAIDFDPQRNAARSFKRGECPTPWTDEWREIWPRGVDQAFVEAMESVGWTWGGVWGARGGDFAARAHGCAFADPMHFQLVGA